MNKALTDRLNAAEQAMLRRLSDADLERLAYGDDGATAWLADCTESELRRIAAGGAVPTRFNREPSNA